MPKTSTVVASHNAGSRQDSAIRRDLDRGAAAIRDGEFDAAIDSYRKVVAARPGWAEARNDLGNALQLAWRLEEAAEEYGKAVELRPDFATAHHNLGICLLATGRTDSALEALERALELRPDHLDTMLSLCEAYKKAGRLEELYATAEAIRAAHRDDAPLLVAVASHQAGQKEIAITSLEELLADTPDDVEALKFLGLMYSETQRYAEALSTLDRAVELRPDDGEIRFYRSIEMLRQGRFEEGFREYEWRWKHPGFPTPRKRLPVPQWDGTPKPDATLLVHTEQGLGDSIQFIRFCGLIRERVGRIVVQCELGLARLFRQIDAIDEVVVDGEELPEFDFHVPMLSVPLLLGTTTETIPSDPYLGLEPTSAGAARWFDEDPRPTVGIVWAGSPSHVKDEERSLPLSLLKPVLERPDIRFASLQKRRDGDLEQAGIDIIDLSPRISDFLDTAEAILSMDVVLTVDTSVAHLAGALGKPVVVMLPYDADWRWQIGRTDSPWYPSMRLVRQPAEGDWASVLDEVTMILNELATTVNPSPTAGTSSDESGWEARKHFLAALEEHRRGNAVDAERLYRLAIETDSTLAEPHNNLGALLADTGRQAEAAASFAKAVELKPDYGEAMNNLGLLCRTAGRMKEALAFFQRAADTDPSRADWLNNAGNVLIDMNQLAEAIVVYDRVLEADPDYVYAANNRAVALRGLGHYEESIEILQGILAEHPNYVEAINNLGLALRDARRYEEALDWFTRALSVAPETLDVRINHATVLQELGRFEEARTAARSILADHPGCHDAYETLGQCAFDEGDFASARSHFDHAIRLNANAVNSHWNQSLISLLEGDLERGFREYEWRKELIAFSPNMRSYNTPHWDGSPLDGKSILLISEQGLGDTFQFVRYAELLKAAGAGRVLVECEESMVSLLRSIEAIDEVVGRGSSETGCDVHCYMLSLPGLVGTTEATIPARVPYIGSPERAVADLVEPGSTLKVGIVWAGSARHARDRARSIDIERLQGLLDLEGVEFYSLQKGAAEADLENIGEDLVTPLGPQISDFDDTAAILSRLDLLITVDTSVAHLSGALGRPTWVLLPFVPDWRWMLDRDDSPWYPTARLFRQPRLDDWDSVISKVAVELTRLRDEKWGLKPNDLRETRTTERRMTAPDTAFAMADDIADCVNELLRPGDTFIQVHPAASGIPGRSIVDSGKAVELVAVVNGRPAPDFFPLQHSYRQADDIPNLVEREISKTTRCFVWWEEESRWFATAAGRGTLRIEPLTGVFWKPGDETAVQSALHALVDAGFITFRIVRDDQGVYLDPVANPLEEELLISIRESRLAEIAEGSDGESADGPTKQEATAAPTAPPVQLERLPVGIDWEIGATSGWQVYGSNLAAQLAARDDTRPMLGLPTDPMTLPPLARFCLREAVTESGNRSDGEGMLVFRALGNSLEGSPSPIWPNAAANVGVIFFEDTALMPAQIERANGYDLIVAGSTWNAEMLRARGVRRVVRSLQGIDPTLFHPAAPSGLFDDRFVIFSGGKLEFRKGQDIVVAAYREFQRRHPEALLIFAWHNMWPQIMNEIPLGGHVDRPPSSDPSGNIDFAGWLLDQGLPDGSFLDLGIVPNAQMPQLLREADAALFPNRAEGGTNLVAMESIACGIPAVVSANTGHLDLTAIEGVYPLVDQRPVERSINCAGVEGWGESSVDEIVETLERIHADQRAARTNGLRAAERMAHLSWKNQIDQLISTVAGALGGGHG